MNVVDMCFQQLKRSEDRLRPTPRPCAFSRGIVEDINNMSISDMVRASQGVDEDFGRGATGPVA
jgi:hypothetical protein